MGATIAPIRLHSEWVDLVNARVFKAIHSSPDLGTSDNKLICKPSETRQNRESWREMPLRETGLQPETASPSIQEGARTVRERAAARLGEVATSDRGGKEGRDRGRDGEGREESGGTVRTERIRTDLRRGGPMTPGPASSEGCRS